MFWKSVVRKKKDVVSVTVSPERSDLVLSADVPDGERNVLVLDSLDIKTCERELNGSG